TVFLDRRHRRLRPPRRSADQIDETAERRDAHVVARQTGIWRATRPHARGRIVRPRTVRRDLVDGPTENVDLTVQPDDGDFLKRFGEARLSRPSALGRSDRSESGEDDGSANNAATSSAPWYKHGADPAMGVPSLCRLNSQRSPPIHKNDHRKFASA